MALMVFQDFWWWGLLLIPIVFIAQTLMHEMSHGFTGAIFGLQFRINPPSLQNGTIASCIFIGDTFGITNRQWILVTLAPKINNTINVILAILFFHLTPFIGPIAKTISFLFLTANLVDFAYNFFGLFIPNRKNSWNDSWRFIELTKMELDNARCIFVAWFGLLVVISLIR